MKKIKISKMKDLLINKGKLKYLGVVILAFLSLAYLATATSVITDIQATFDSIITGNLTVSGNLTAKTGRTATIVVAASDSSSISKAQADYVCDGVDDQVEIQAAIDALSSNGGLVQLLDGNFVISDTINLKKFVGLKGQEGGRSTEISLASNSDSDMISFGQTDTTSSFIYIGHMTLHGNKDNQASGNGIHFINNSNSVKDVLIDRVYVSDCKEDGIKLEDVWGARIRDSLAENCGNSGFNIDCNQCYLNNCFAASNVGDGFTITGQYIHMTNCFAFENQKHGFNFTSLPQLSLVSSGAHNNGQAAALTYHNFLFSSVQDSTISGCVSRDTTSNIDVGFYLFYSSKIALVGSESTGTRYGVRIYPDTSTAVVTGNYVEGSTAAILGTAGVIANNGGYVTENSGNATVANNGWFAHGLADTPSAVTLTPINGTYDGVPVVMGAIDKNSTDVKVSVYWTNGTAITTALQTYWYAEV